MIPIIYLQLFKLDQIFVTNRSSKRVVPWGYLSYTQQKELDMYIKQITACNIQLLLLDNDKNDCRRHECKGGMLLYTIHLITK